MMRSELSDLLNKSLEDQALPTIIAYNRVDGPGSSLDLREFQQTFWSKSALPKDANADTAMAWSKHLPRTVGITLDIGTRIEARPFKSGLISVISLDYGTEVVGKLGEIPPIKENWLLKILDLFGLSGVKFVLENLHEGTKSSGLGGSATATTGVCILANELAGRPFSEIQLISMASRIEQDFGVSITGTQEQSNVVFGGVIDYVWFTWGIPEKPGTGYGESIRSELIKAEDYRQLERRMAIFHSGRTHSSIDVNSIWRDALYTTEGYKLHSKKLEIAYDYREGLRLQDWNMVVDSVRRYQKVRTEICPSYLNGAKDILKRSEAKDCTAFPLGAGGGGGILVFSIEPDSLEAVRDDLNNEYREIPVKIKNLGHELKNIPVDLK